MSNSIECEICENIIIHYTLHMGKIHVEESDELEYYENDDGEYICSECYHKFKPVRIQ